MRIISGDDALVPFAQIINLSQELFSLEGRLERVFCLVNFHKEMYFKLCSLDRFLSSFELLNLLFEQ